MRSGQLEAGAETETSQVKSGLSKEFTRNKKVHKEKKITHQHRETTEQLLILSQGSGQKKEK